MSCHRIDWDYDFTGSMRTVSFGNISDGKYNGHSRRSSRENGNKGRNGKSKRIMLIPFAWGVIFLYELPFLSSYFVAFFFFFENFSFWMIVNLNLFCFDLKKMM